MAAEAAEAAAKEEADAKADEAIAMAASAKLWRLPGTIPPTSAWWAIFAT